MKQTLLLLSVLLFAFGCKKNDASPSGSNAMIVGKWNYTADTVKQYQNSTLQWENDADFVPSTTYIQFNSDGTGNQELANTGTTFTYTVSQNIVTINTPAQFDGRENVSASTDKAVIRKLTSTSLNLFFDWKGSDPAGTYEQTESAYMTKQN